MFSNWKGELTDDIMVATDHETTQPVQLLFKHSKTFYDGTSDHAYIMTLYTVACRILGFKGPLLMEILQFILMVKYTIYHVIL